MNKTNTVIAIFDSHEQAESAIKQLQQASIDMKSLSIAAKIYIRMSMSLATTIPATE